MSYKDEKGILNTKHCAVTNFIRWRYAGDAQSAKAKDGLQEAENQRMER